MVDILVFAVHPDDAELGCSGTIAKHKALGHKIALIDFTRGELGTRGTPEIRLEESQASAQILGLDYRENLGFKDGFFKNDEDHQRILIQKIRKYRPKVVLCNAPHDRHPDHGRAGSLAIEACFYAGLRKIETVDENNILQSEFRPEHVFQYIQDRYIEPDFVVDISAYWSTKINSIRAFKSQFYDPNNSEPSSYISSTEFIEFVEARSKEMGHKIGVAYGEGFLSSKKIQINNLLDLV
ncbi:MAG: bacillithiol biosynthesis deacetylase BshB1 [Leadbetterella sp.]